MLVDYLLPLRPLLVNFTVTQSIKQIASWDHSEVLQS